MNDEETRKRMEERLLDALQLLEAWHWGNAGFLSDRGILSMVRAKLIPVMEYMRDPKARVFSDKSGE